MKEGLLQPKDLAKECGINKSTLNGYLKDEDLFPPVQKDSESGYRYYNKETILTLKLIKVFRKRPYRLKTNEIKPILKKNDIKVLNDIYNDSNQQLYDYLRKKNLL
jgi:DNA-binding transcriptional MerR regulator